MDQVDPSIWTFILCTQREKFYIPPELLRLILLLAGELQPTNAEDLAWVPEEFRQEEDIYRFDCPQYLRSDPDLRECIEYGAVNCLQLYIDRELPKSEEACEWAAEEGQLECLRLLIANGFPKSECACAWAADGGHLECLRLLITNNFPKTEYACEWAAGGGHIQCLQLLIDNDFPKTEDDCACAAEYDHTQCLQLLIDNKFPNWESYR